MIEQQLHGRRRVAPARTGGEADHRRISAQALEPRLGIQRGAIQRRGELLAQLVQPLGVELTGDPQDFVRGECEDDDTQQERQARDDYRNAPPEGLVDPAG